MNTSTIGADERREGKVAKAIEKETAKLPSDLFLWAAGAAIAGSLALQVVGMLQGKRRMGMLASRENLHPLGNFVGMWAPTFLLLGIYNKIVKVAGSDRMESRRSTTF